MIDLKIHKHKKNKGKFFHKTIRGVESSKTKKQDLKDISKYESSNYVKQEFLILKIEKLKEFSESFKPYLYKFI